MRSQYQHVLLAAILPMVVPVSRLVAILAGSESLFARCVLPSLGPNFLLAHKIKPPRQRLHFLHDQAFRDIVDLDDEFPPLVERRIYQAASKRIDGAAAEQELDRSVAEEAGQAGNRRHMDEDFRLCRRPLEENRKGGSG